MFGGQEGQVQKGLEGLKWSFKDKHNFYIVNEGENYTQMCRQMNILVWELRKTDSQMGF